MTCRSIKARQLVQLEPDRQAITGRTPSSATGQYLPSFYLHSCRRAHESSFYHLRSKIKFVFPEMRKLGMTGRIARRFCCCLFVAQSLHSYPHPNFNSGTDIKSVADVPMMQSKTIIAGVTWPLWPFLNCPNSYCMEFHIIAVRHAG